MRQEVSPLTQEERTLLHDVIEAACEPIAPFWPMRTMVAQNPIHGLEYLPFDEAVRQGKDLLGGNGYLSNEDYRRLYREGRITSNSIQQALTHVGPQSHTQDSIQIGAQPVSSQDIWRWHLVTGFEELEPALLQWELSGGRATKQFRSDFPADSKQRIVQRTIKDCERCRDFPEEAYLTNLWNATLRALGLHESSSEKNHGQESSSTVEQESREIPIHLPVQRTMSDWIERLSGVPLVEQINNQMIKWIAAFVDEGLAGWEMPQKHRGFFLTWRELVQWDHSGHFLGISDFHQKVRDLSDDPEEVIVSCLRCSGVPQAEWKAYLSRELSQLPGWTRYIRWLGEHPRYHAQRKQPIDVRQYLAVRLVYEVELTQVICQREWGIEGTVPALQEFWGERGGEYEHPIGLGRCSVDPITQMTCRDAWRLFHLAQCLEVAPADMHDLSRTDAQVLLRWLDAFPSDLHGPVWLEALEDSFRKDILGKLSLHCQGVKDVDTRPQAQLVFCIDVRSESFRRHIEAQGPYETFGFAGFFGIPISHQAFDSEQRSDLCPVLLTPNHAVREVPRSEENDSLQRYSSGTRWYHLGHHLFHDLKHHPIGSMMVIDVLGFFFSLGLVGKTLLQKIFRGITSTIEDWFTHRVRTQIAVSASSDPTHPKIGEVHPEGIPSDLAQGFSLTEQATFIENGLRAMGLTKNYARLVCLCGHGSETDNNPYYGALDCGACGGAPGDANARVFAAMANSPDVRRVLGEKGLSIPSDTWFLPGKHNTTTDRVQFYDVEDLPDSHLEDLRVLEKDLKEAGANQALERCHRLPHAPTQISPEHALAHVEERSCDWANTRPEWGLAGNAAFLIGRRRLTKGLDLGGRVFLHSYDPIADSAGGILEKIMTAPLIVGEWINTGYYFSGADPWKYGSGSKVLHNVVGGVGMMLGSQSDLQMGFPLQTVNDGDRHYHEPMRLLAIIEHTPCVISSIIQKHGILQQLFHNQWLHLVALDPHAYEFHQYHADGRWERVSPTE